MPAFRFLELPSDRPLVHLQRLVGKRGHRIEDHGHQRRVPAFLAELPEMRDVRVGPFASRLQEPVLVDSPRPFVGDAELAQEGEPLDGLEDVARIGRSAGLAEPPKMRLPGVGCGVRRSSSRTRCSGVRSTVSDRYASRRARWRTAEARRSSTDRAGARMRRCRSSSRSDLTNARPRSVPRASVISHADISRCSRRPNVFQPNVATSLARCSLRVWSRNA